MRIVLAQILILKFIFLIDFLCILLLFFYILFGRDTIILLKGTVPRRLLFAAQQRVAIV
jgi:hypothetical protein